MDEQCITHEELLTCLEIGKALTSTLSLDEVLFKIMERISGQVPATDWSLLLRDEKTGSLSFKIFGGKVCEGPQDVVLRRGEGIAGHVAESGEPLFIGDTKCDGRHSKRVDVLTSFTTESLVCLPLKCRGKVLGVLEIVNPKSPAILEGSLPPMLELLLDYGAIAIDNSRLYEHTRYLAVTDHYTDLPNARAMHDFLEAALEEAKDAHLSVVFIDMDNFKDIVDTYGHLEGSRVLREVGQAFLSAFDGDDRLFKYGGDEYVAVLPGKCAEAAFGTVERMREALRGREFLGEGGVGGIAVTASFGIASYPAVAKSKKELLLAADHAMYIVKNSSKNSCACADLTWKSRTKPHTVIP